MHASYHKKREAHDYLKDLKTYTSLNLIGTFRTSQAPISHERSCDLSSIFKKVMSRFPAY